MKMEYTLSAPFNGLVAELAAETGGQVDVGEPLVQLDESDDA